VVTKPLSETEKRELKEWNDHLLGRMSHAACDALRKFLKALAARGTFVRLYSPIPKGHVVDFELRHGRRADVRSVAAEFKIDVTNIQFTVRHVTEGHQLVQVEAQEVSGFEADVDMSDAGKPIN
jgi:hypothetical protein